MEVRLTHVIFSLSLFAFYFSPSPSPFPSPSPTLTLGRGMNGPGRGHVRTPQHCHVKKTVTTVSILTEQRKQLVASCLSKELLLCVYSSQLGQKRDFHVSALLCLHRSLRSHQSHRSQPLLAAIRRQIPPTNIVRGLSMQQLTIPLNRNPSFFLQQHPLVRPSLTAGPCWASQLSWCE